MNFQEMTLWGTISVLIYSVGYPPTSWQFWCFLATYWAVAFLSKQSGKIDGVLIFLDLPEDEQRRLKQEIKEIEEDSK